MQRKICSLVFSCAILAQMSVASAQDRTWRPNVSGNWSDNTRWSDDDRPDTDTENAIFANNFTPVVATVDQSFSIGNLTLNSTNTLSIGSGNTLTINNFINNSLGVLTGAGNLVVNGTGVHNWETILMSGTGSTTFNAGELRILRLNSPSQVTGRTIQTNAITNWTDDQNALTLTGARWENLGTFTRNQTTGVARNLDLNGTSTFHNRVDELNVGVFRQVGSIGLTVEGGTFINDGIVESAGSTLTFNSDVGLTNSGTMRTAGGTLALNGSIINAGSIRAENGNITISGNFTNNGGDLVAVGSNTISINSGTYTHNGGKFIVDGGNIGGTAALAINTVGSDVGGIEGVGSITQSVTMSADTYIAPGNSIGTITFADLTMTGGRLDIEVGGALLGETDLITINGTGTFTNVSVDATLFGGFQPAFVGQEFTFLQASNAAAIIGQLSLTPESLSNFSGFSLTGSGNGINLVSAVPEPSSLALLGLCTGLGLFARKRRGAANV
jgi:hypothetical protein